MVTHQRKKWHFCREEPRCREPCRDCWRTLDGRKLLTREEMQRRGLVEEAQP